MKKKLDYKNWRNPIVIKRGWWDHGKKGTQVGAPVFVRQWWVPVLWADEEDPDFFKAAGLDGVVFPDEPCAHEWDDLMGVDRSTDPPNWNKVVGRRCEKCEVMEWGWPCGDKTDAHPSDCHVCRQMRVKRR